MHKNTPMMCCDGGKKFIYARHSAFCVEIFEVINWKIDDNWNLCRRRSCTLSGGFLSENEISKLSHLNKHFEWRVCQRKIFFPTCCCCMTSRVRKNKNKPKLNEVKTEEHCSFSILVISFLFISSVYDSCMDCYLSSGLTGLNRHELAKTFDRKKGRKLQRNLTLKAPSRLNNLWTFTFLPPVVDAHKRAGENLKDGKFTAEALIW